MFAYGSVWCAIVVGTYLRCLTERDREGQSEIDKDRLSPVLRQTAGLRLPYTDVLEV